MKTGVVIIGRNEGRRLEICLASVARPDRATVYVDSGSTDQSVAVADAAGARVVALDMRMPFTAGRARNAGFERLRQAAPQVELVQFVDGDCEVAAAWIERAAAFLEAHADVAVACGRLRERHPERSVYNLLCDLEWDAPVGEAKACGGNAMVRRAAFEAVGGFREDLIAGEEPELCVRLRAAGWKIWRLPDDMAKHDAHMLSFGQWWRRATRAGVSYAAGARLHGGTPERHRVRESRSAWLWAAGLPALAVLACTLLGPAGLGVLLAYPLQVARLALTGRRSARENWARALFLVLGKFPEALGLAKFHLLRVANRTPRLIEYK